MNHSSLKYIDGFSEIFNSNISENHFIKIEIIQGSLIVESAEEVLGDDNWDITIKNESNLNSLYKKIQDFYKVHFAHKNSKKLVSSYIRNIKFDLNSSSTKGKWTIRISNHHGRPEKENEKIRSFITSEQGKKSFPDNIEFYVPSEKWPLEYKGNSGITMKQILDDMAGLTKIENLNTTKKMKTETKNILYIHGLNSSGNSNTATQISKLLPEGYTLIAPDFSSAYTNFSVMQDNINRAKQIIKSNNIVLVVASSMGGFIAMNCTNIPKVLINPCMKPSEQLARSMNGNISEKELEKFEKLENAITPTSFDKKYTLALFSNKDELFSYKELFQTKYNKANAFNVNDGHRLSNSNIKNELLTTMELLLNINEQLMETLQTLNERYITAFDKTEMKKYAAEVWAILELSYAKIGGTKYIAPNVDVFIEKTDIWKMVRKGGKIVAVACYKTKRGGRKSVAAGTNGTPIGKEWLYNIIKEDIKMADRFVWSEVSGVMEYLKIEKYGAVPIPAKIAQEILSDKELIIHDDGIHYTRMIGGKPFTKIMCGNFPNIKN